MAGVGWLLLCSLISFSHVVFAAATSPSELLVENIALSLKVDVESMEHEADNAIYLVYGPRASHAAFEQYMQEYLQIGVISRWDMQVVANSGVGLSIPTSSSNSMVSISNIQSITSAASLKKITALHEVTDKSRSSGSSFILLLWDSSVEELLPSSDAYLAEISGRQVDSSGAAQRNHAKLSPSFAKRAKEALLRRWRAVAGNAVDVNSAALVGRISRVITLVLPPTPPAPTVVVAAAATENAGTATMVARERERELEGEAGIESLRSAFRRRLDALHKQRAASATVSVGEAGSTVGGVVAASDDLVDMAAAALSSYMGIFGNFVVDAMLFGGSDATWESDNDKAVREQLRTWAQDNSMLLCLVTVNMFVLLLLMVGTVVALLSTQPPTRPAQREQQKPRVVQQDGNKLAASSVQENTSTSATTAATVATAAARSAATGTPEPVVGVSTGPQPRRRTISKKSSCGETSDVHCSSNDSSRRNRVDSEETREDDEDEEDEENEEARAPPPTTSRRTRSRAKASPRRIKATEATATGGPTPPAPATARKGRQLRPRKDTSAATAGEDSSTTGAATVRKSGRRKAAVDK